MQIVLDADITNIMSYSIANASTWCSMSKLVIYINVS